MSKLSFRARALDASKPLPVFRCEDLPDLHEYASINRAVPQMPTGMEKEEESVRVNSPVRPAARPRSLRCLRRRRSTDPHKMAAIFSPPPTPGAGRALTPPPPASTPGRRGPAGPPFGPPADPGPLDPGPAQFGRPKGTKGSRDKAAGSHFVVGALGLGLVHPERERAGRRGCSGGPACSPLRGPLGGALGPARPPRAAGAGSAGSGRAGALLARLPAIRSGGAAPRGAPAAGQGAAGLRAAGGPGLRAAGIGLLLSVLFRDFCIHFSRLPVSRRVGGELLLFPTFALILENTLQIWGMLVAFLKARNFIITCFPESNLIPPDCWLLNLEEKRPHLKKMS